MKPVASTVRWTRLATHRSYPPTAARNRSGVGDDSWEHLYERVLYEYTASRMRAHAALSRARINHRAAKEKGTGAAAQDGETGAAHEFQLVSSRHERARMIRTNKKSSAAGESL
jgi:hypothetical protein